MEWVFTPPPVFVQDGTAERVAQQLAFFRHTGVVDATEDIVRGEDGEAYYFPTTDHVNDRLLTSWDGRYQGKFAQGFGLLRIVPGIAGRYALQNPLGKVILARKGDLKSAWGEKLDLNTGEPVWENWKDNATILYRTAQPGLNYGDDTPWVTASTFYGNMPVPGFDIVLVCEADNEMPRKGAGRIFNARPDTEGGKSPLDHRQMFGVEPYEHECALSTDGTLVHYSQTIHETGVVPDVLTDSKGTITWCSDNGFECKDMNAANAGVPILYFDRSDRQVNALWYDASFSLPFFAVRAAVRIY